MVAIVVAGSIGPWVEVPGASKGGLDGDGVFTIVVAAVAGAYLVFVARPHWAPIVMAGFLTAFASIYDIVDIEDLGGFFGDLATPGWGIIATALGAVGLVLSAVLALRREDPEAEVGVAGKVMLGLGSVLIILFVIYLADGKEEAKSPTIPTPQEPEIEPPRSP